MHLDKMEHTKCLYDLTLALSSMSQARMTSCWFSLSFPTLLSNVRSFETNIKLDSERSSLLNLRTKTISNQLEVTNI